MKVGFLSIDKENVDKRTAEMVLFDNGHTADIFMTVNSAKVDYAVSQLRSFCDLIVVEGNVEAFYSTYKDTLPQIAENFELDGKLYAITPYADTEYLKKRFAKLLESKAKKNKFRTSIFKTYGKSESELKEELKEFSKSNRRIKIGYFPIKDECEVHLRCPLNMDLTAYSNVCTQVNMKLHSCTYSYDDASIVETVAAMLKRNNLRLKIAESFTGGAICQTFTSLKGASEYFAEGIIAYSVRSKVNRLAVPTQLIAEKGVVSGETANEMCQGLLLSRDCDVAIATTGNAGPTVGGNGDVGTCYIAIGDMELIQSCRYTFNGDRKQNIESGVNKAIFLLYEYLTKYELQRLKLHEQQSN